MHVTALYRYPIKSHGSEAIEAVTLTAGQTMPWDRHWAVSHEASKFDNENPKWEHCRNFMLASRTPRLAAISAQLDEASATVTLAHPDLASITLQPDVPQDVARFLDWVAPLCPEGRVTAKDIVKAPNRGMTDSALASISLMSETSQKAVSEALDAPLEHGRWRGNIWFDGASAWEELTWIGRTVLIGGATLALREPCVRCSLTNTNPATGIRDTDTLGVLKRDFGHQHFGVYAEVLTGGTLCVGDKVQLQ